MEQNENQTVEQVIDEEPKALTETLMTFREYSQSVGMSYENVRKTVKKIENSPEYKEHIHQMKNPKTGQMMTYIDQTIIDYIESKRRVDPVVVVSDTEKISSLEYQLKEAIEDRDRQRNEKELYMKKVQEVQEQLLQMKEHPEQAIDASKYILLEDHKKLEEELVKKEDRIEELTEENTKLEEENATLKEDQEALKNLTMKNVELSKTNEKRLKEIEQKQQEIREAEKRNDEINRELAEAERAKDKANAEKMLLEAEKTKIEAESDRLKAEVEIERRRAEQEYEEALKLGFFARRKKLKELKKRKEEE